MARVPFNVLVLPYRLGASGYEYAVFHRANVEMWQFIAGGGEGDEEPATSARREGFEEGGILGGARWMGLDSRASIPCTAFPGAPWAEDVYVVPEYSFAVDIGDAALSFSVEHDRFVWCGYEAACARLTWDSNRVALWELRERLIKWVVK
jgi:dATP pyrophosphohydrolase